MLTIWKTSALITTCPANGDIYVCSNWIFWIPFILLESIFLFTTLTSYRSISKVCVTSKSIEHSFELTSGFSGSILWTNWKKKKKKLNQNITKIREKSSWAENRYPNSSLPAVALLVTVNPTGSVMCVHKQQTSKLLQEQLSWCLVKGLCSNHEHHYVWK